MKYLNLPSEEIQTITGRRIMVLKLRLFYFHYIVS